MLLRVHAQCTSPLETHSNQRTTCARSVCGWFASLRCTIIKCPLTDCTRSHIVPRSAMSSLSNTLHFGSNRRVATKRVFRQLPSSDRMSSALVATGCPFPRAPRQIFQPMGHSPARNGTSLAHRRDTRSVQSSCSPSVALFIQARRVSSILSDIKRLLTALRPFHAGLAYARYAGSRPSRPHDSQ